MKKLLLLQLIVFLFLYANVSASCLPGNSEVIVEIIPDSWPAETSWDITDNSGNILASGGSVGDTVCIPTGLCVLFTIHDGYGDGIYAPGGYWVYVDGVQVVQPAPFAYSAQYPIACPAGSYCTSAQSISTGSYTAMFDNSWYVYTPTVTGTYNLNSCGQNTCDTKIWVYATCSGILNDETPAGSYAFNDNSTCGLQANLDVVLIAGQTYYIRIGDNLDNCTGTIDFTFSYVGPVQGCTDPTSCNYNPLAVIDDGSCIYFPSPGCAGPDLELDSMAFIQSMMLFNTFAANCDVDEGCVTGYGNRYVISFTSKVNNIGTLDYLIGDPGSNPTMFNVVNCHGHAHYEGYGDYRLYDAAGHLVPAGHKNGFCVMDLCGFGQYNCGMMGISAGCYDEYGAGTQCQWIDITDVPDGDYRLAAIINSRHLPDALGHNEINYINNALQVCMRIQRNASGIPSYSLLPNCTPYIDCVGIPGGASMLDCAGICNGPGIHGNINGDAELDSLDVLTYTDILGANSGTATTCNDLNGDGVFSVYDAQLANWCIHTNHHPHPAGSNFNPCNFPHNIVNPNDTVGLAISNVNLSSQYVDIEIKNPTADVSAYQFTMHGITVSNIISLANPIDYPCDPRVISGTNGVFALSQQDSSLTRNLNAQTLCRVYYSAITDTIICIESIQDVINSKGERTQPYLYGSCATSVTVGISENQTVPLNLFPNPVQHTAILQLPHGEKPLSLSVTDMTGREISMTATVSKHSTYEIDLSNLSSGVYLLKVETTNGTGTVRFAKF